MGSKTKGMCGSIHFFFYQQLDVRENPNLKFPPRPPEAIEPSLEFYKVNFDINVQLRKAGANVPVTPEASPCKLLIICLPLMVNMIDKIFFIKSV